MISIWHFYAVKVELCETHLTFLCLHCEATLRFLMKSPWPLSYCAKKPEHCQCLSRCSSTHYQHFIQISFRYLHRFSSYFANKLQTNQHRLSSSLGGGNNPTDSGLKRGFVCNTPSFANMGQTAAKNSRDNAIFGAAKCFNFLPENSVVICLDLAH